jgi:hypothetical protein
MNDPNTSVDDVYADLAARPGRSSGQPRAIMSLFRRAPRTAGRAHIDTAQRVRFALTDGLESAIART